MSTAVGTRFEGQAIPLLMLFVSFIISVIGIILSVYSISYVVTYGITATGLLLALLTAACALTLVAGFAWLLVTDFTLKEIFRVGMWALSAFIIVELVLLLILYYALESGRSVASLELTAPTLLSLGVVAGFVTGVNSIQRANAANTARERLEQIEFLNSILRHEILNSHTVIQGHASHLASEEQPLDEDTIETIVSRSKSVTDRVESIRSLIELINTNKQDYGGVDLLEQLESEVQTARVSFPEVDISVESDIPEDLRIEGNRLLSCIFENLIGNAIEHNPSESPKVDIEIEHADGTATVTVRDNGTGLPADLAKALEYGDRSTLLDAGYGLYIVHTIVEQFGGTIVVTESPTGGTAILVELNLATHETATVGSPSLTASITDRVGTVSDRFSQRAR